MLVRFGLILIVPEDKEVRFQVPGICMYYTYNLNIIILTNFEKKFLGHKRNIGKGLTNCISEEQLSSRYKEQFSYRYKEQLLYSCKGLS